MSLLTGSEWIKLGDMGGSFKEINENELQSSSLAKIDEGKYGCEVSNGIKPDLWTEFTIKLTGK